MEQLRPTWVEINMANLAYNFRQVKKRIGLKVKVLAPIPKTLLGLAANRAANIKR